MLLPRPRALLLLGVPSALCTAQTRGIVVTSDTATVFDADRAEPLVTFQETGSSFFSDCAVSSDGTSGYVTEFVGDVLVLDLTADPAQIVPTIRRIPHDAIVQEADLTTDDRYLVCGSTPQVLGGVFPMALVDVESGAVTNAFNDDGHLAIRSEREFFIKNTNEVYRSRIVEGPRGAMLDLYLEQVPSPLSVDFPECSPDGRWLVLRGGPALNELVVLDATDFHVASTRPFRVHQAFPGGGNGRNVVFRPDGRELFVLTSRKDGAVLSAHAFDPDTGTTGDALWRLPSSTFAGSPDRFAVHPDGRTLFHGLPGRLQRVDTADGTVLATFVIPSTDERFQFLAVALPRGPAPSPASVAPTRRVSAVARGG